MNNTNDFFTRRSERRVNAFYDKIVFDDLFRTARELYLKDDPEAREMTIDPVVCKLGVRGVSVALEATVMPDLYGSEVPECDEKDQFYISPDSPMSHPLSFGNELDPAVIAKIQGLGEGLLREAHNVLGTDSLYMARKFAEAETDEEQIAIIDWLFKRCIKIKTMKAEGHKASIEDKYYHPIRISPKMIGAYPYINLDPTCFSYSVICASFFEQAGAAHLNAGVTSTHYSTLKKVMAAAAYSIRESTKNDGQTAMSDALTEDMRWVRKEENTGYHAVSIVRLQSGRWYVIDPNYSQAYRLKKKASESVSKAHQHVVDMEDFAPGCELFVDLGHTSASNSFIKVIEKLKSLNLDMGSVEDILLSGDPDALAFRVYTALAEQIGSAIGLEESDNSVGSILTDIVGVEESAADSDDVFINGYWNRFAAAWDTYILAGKTPEELVNRLARDKSMRERVVLDISKLPLIAVLGLIKEEINQCVRWGGHSLDERAYYTGIEIGLPAYRIGCAALSDLAVYTNAPLSSQFFLSYWPSRIPVTETIGCAPTLTDDDSISTAAKSWMDIQGVAYPQQYDMI